MLRHKVKAGDHRVGRRSTAGGGNTSIEKRIEYDLYYIERWSLSFDLKILLQTFWYGFRIKPQRALSAPARLAAGGR